MTVKKRTFKKGIIVKPDAIALEGIEGEIKVDSADNKIKTTLNSSSKEIVTNDQTQTLTNKTIDSANNTLTVDADEASVSNLEVDNLKAGVLDSDLTSVSASHDTIPSALAVKTYVDDQIATKDEASEISYNNATSGLTATDVQAAVDEVEGRVDTIESATYVNSFNSRTGTVSPATSDYDAIQIDYDNTTSGLTATNAQAAIDEVDGNLDTHLADTTAHGTTGNVVGTSDTQTLTNKTIDADLNTISNLAHGAEVDNPSSGVHGVTGNIVGTSDTQTLTNKTITGASIQTPTRLDVKQDTYANLVTYAASASNGQLVFATDLKLMYQVKDNLLTEVGGGGTGSPDIYEVFDAEDQDATGFTNITISGTSPLADSYSYVVGSYPASFPVVTVNERNKDKLNGLKLQYKMTSGTARLVIKDQSSNELGSTQISSTINQSVSIQFFVSSTVTSVQLFIEDVSSATGLKIDDVVFTDNPFVSIKLNNINSISLSGNDGRTITANTEDMFWSGSGTGWTGGADGAASFYKIQASNSILTLQGSINYAAGDAGAISIYKNTVLHKRIDATASISTFSYISSKGEFALGDNISIRVASGGTLSNSSTNHNLNILEEVESENLVFSQSGTENEFSAQITNNGTAAIVTQSSPNSPAIASVSRTSLGRVLVTFTANFFSVAPHISAVVYGRDGRETTISTVATTTGCTINTTDGGAQEDNNFYISIRRAGTDYKNPNAYAVVPYAQIAYLKDVKATGTDGGTFTSGSYQTRALNTVEGDSFITLSSNQFTLPAGTYEIESIAPAYRVGANQSKLRNITDSSDAILGTSVFSSATADYSDSVSEIKGRLVLTSQKTFELQHRGTNTQATNGFGVANAFGDSEVYSIVKITKVR